VRAQRRVAAATAATDVDVAATATERSVATATASVATAAATTAPAATVSLRGGRQRGRDQQQRRRDHAQAFSRMCCHGLNPPTRMSGDWIMVDIIIRSRRARVIVFL
jgi:hypothetical protein